MKWQVTKDKRTWNERNGQMEYSYHEMEKTNIKYLNQWMTETQNCENIKVDNQELPDIRTSYQEFEALAYPVVHSWIKLKNQLLQQMMNS